MCFYLSSRLLIIPSSTQGTDFIQLCLTLPSLKSPVSVMTVVSVMTHHSPRAFAFSHIRLHFNLGTKEISKAFLP